MFGSDLMVERNTKKQHRNIKILLALSFKLQIRVVRVLSANLDEFDVPASFFFFLGGVTNF